VPRIEFVYALPARQWVREMVVPEGMEVLAAIAQADLGALWPEVDLTECEPRVWGHPLEPGQIVRDGDRCEFLRPLVADPKEARRRRVSRPRT
jgi:putative ubiquitin-RnfH superfamily antitoxin RatB of RatAB toxin-antitoxin module